MTCRSWVGGNAAHVALLVDSRRRLLGGLDRRRVLRLFAGGLQTTSVGDDICWWTPGVVVDCRWNLARSRPADLPVDAPRRERGNLVGVVLRSVWPYGPSHTWHGFAILESVFFPGGFVDSLPPLQDPLTLGWMWPRSRVGESACVLRAFDLSSRGVHIPPEVRIRPGQGRRTCPGLGGTGS